MNRVQSRTLNDSVASYGASGDKSGACGTCVYLKRKKNRGK